MLTKLVILSNFIYIYSRPGLEVNFSVHSHSLAGKIFSTSKLVRPLANSFQMFGRHDDSNSQTFASGYFSHSQLIKITRILRVCER